MRVVTILINDRCPLRCRHCSVGFSETNHGTKYRITVSDLARMIAAIDSQIYAMALFAGGEPSLDPHLVKAGVDECRRAGIESGIVTAPVWAATEEDAKRFLDKIPGIDQIFLSYDTYHLEFLRFAHYENAAQEALLRGIPVTFHMVYSKPAEREALIASLSIFEGMVRINAVPTVPIGNAANPFNVAMNYVTINSVEDLNAIPRRCVLGNALVDSNFSVHGCCWSSTAESSPFSSKPGNFTSAFRDMEQSPVFQSVLRNGFLGSLTAEGQQSLVDYVRGQRFCNECDICVAAMKKNTEAIWSQCSLQGAAENKQGVPA